MAEVNIVLGRDERDLKKYGTLGCAFVGKQYIKMGQTLTLANKVLLDVVRPHVILICGKRGEGKSYTMSQIAEGISSLPEEIMKNISILFFDTMGIFWTMKYPNYRDEDLLKKWGLEPRGLENVRVLVPAGIFEELKDAGIPVDLPFTIKTSDLDVSEWCVVLNIDPLSRHGVLLGEVIDRLEGEYDIDDMIRELGKVEEEEYVKRGLKIRLREAKKWGIFSREGTPIDEVVKPGFINILDISPYTHIYGQFSLRALVIALLSKKILEEREKARKLEELETIERGYSYFAAPAEKRKKPLVWIFIDEVHEFLPREGNTVATGPLLQLIREGRQPGISLVVATQQPGKMHTDVLTQCDLVIAHRVTSRMDIDALNTIMQTFMGQDLARYIDELPRVKGCAIVLDQNQERVYQVQMRPKFTWHGGETPTAIPPKGKILI